MIETHRKRKAKPLGPAGAPNKANLCVFEAENEVRHGKRSQFSSRAGRAMRANASAIGKPVLPAATRGREVGGSPCRRVLGRRGITNKANLRCFWPENEGRRKEQSQCAGMGRRWARLDRSKKDSSFGKDKLAGSGS